MRKRILGHIRQAKIQISLHIRAVRSEASLGTFWLAKLAKFLHVDNEDSDQIVRMRSLILSLRRAHMTTTFSDVSVHFQMENISLPNSLLSGQLFLQDIFYDNQYYCLFLVIFSVSRLGLFSVVCFLMLMDMYS